MSTISTDAAADSFPEQFPAQRSLWLLYFCLDAVDAVDFLLLGVPDRGLRFQIDVHRSNGGRHPVHPVAVERAVAQVHLREVWKRGPDRLQAIDSDQRIVVQVQVPQTLQCHQISQKVLAIDVVILEVEVLQPGFPARLGHSLVDILVDGLVLVRLQLDVVVLQREQAQRRAFGHLEPVDLLDFIVVENEPRQLLAFAERLAERR